MAPIRIAIIGLSTTTKGTWAAGAHLPYLNLPRGQERFSIVALCNSSVEAARKAVADFKLPAETKTYGDAQSLADDPDIDMVICATRVDVHHQTILPSIKAGKSVYVEWPLAQDLKHANELADAAKASGSKTIIGLQSPVSPVARSIREILAQGQIGKILSSEVRASGGTGDREFGTPGLKFFADKSIGGNVYTIGFGHSKSPLSCYKADQTETGYNLVTNYMETAYDLVQNILGDINNASARFHLQRPDLKLRDPETKQVIEVVRSNVPDLIYVTGSLAGSDSVQPGALVSVRFRRGQPFPGEPALAWSITGDKGELRVLSANATSVWGAVDPSSITIEVHDFATDEVKKFDWAWEDWQNELRLPARAIGALYETFYEGDESKYATFENARFRHEQLAAYDNQNKYEWQSL
jgi:predicted dehydrogenase